MYQFFINIAKDLLLLLSIPVMVELISWFFLRKEPHNEDESLAHGELPDMLPHTVSSQLPKIKL